MKPNTNQFYPITLLLGLMLLLAFNNDLVAQPVGSANLDQVRNGKADDSPPVPVWVNGNAGEQNSHYVEGYSIPYRVVMDGVPAGTQVTLTLEFDAKHSGRHAIDYLTHYMRLEPHTIFGHVSEVIDPTDGVASESGPADQAFTIPPPVGDNSPIPGMPASSFNALPAAEKMMSIWNGTITNIEYNETPASDLDPTVDKSAQEIFVTFTWGVAGPVILSWGGHIGSRLDWGFDTDGVPNSAGGVSGSPYHMRLIDWESPTVTLTNLGNQDRSLSAAAVITAPDCEIEGPDPVCSGSENTYNAISTDGESYLWSIPGATNNTSASIVGLNDQMSVNVNAGTSAGTFLLEVSITKTVNNVELSTTCDTLITVIAAPNAGDDGTATACNSSGGGSTIVNLPGALGSPDGGGNWSDDDATGVDLSNPAAVDFTGISDGMYDFSYIVMGTAPCDNDTAVVTVTVETCCDLVVVCPSDPAALTCNDEMPPCVTDLAGFQALGGTVSGACNAVTVQCSDNGAVCDGLVVRTLTISDGVSTEMCTLNYTFTKPTLAVNCSNANEDECQSQGDINTAFANWLGAATVSGACGAAPITTDPVDPAAPDACGGTIAVTFSATDECGRTATCTASFTVADAPVLSLVCALDPNLPACTSQADIDQAFLNWMAGASPIGGCGLIGITNNAPAAPGPCGGSISAIFTATDACGQIATCSSTFTVQTATEAVANCPGPVNLDPDPSQSDVNTAFATWIGGFGTNGAGCDVGVIYKINGNVVPDLTGATAPDACGGSMEVEVIALSSCGNDTCTSTFSVPDSEGSLFLNPIPSQLGTCVNRATPPTESDIPGPKSDQEIIQQFLVISGCIDPNDVTISNVLLPVSISGFEYTFERVYTASAPGVSPVSTSEIFMRVWNPDGPVLANVPADITLPCGDDLPPWPVVTGSDVQDGALTVLRNQNERGTSCGMVYERTWSATDECGHTVAAQQIIRFVDEEAPAITVPDDVTIECTELVPDPSYETSDDCSNVTVTVSEERTDHNACEYTLVRTYTAEDDCGNASTAVQTINVVDNVAPEIVLTNPLLAGVENGGEIAMFGCFTPQVAASDVAISDCCGTSLLAFDELVASNVCDVFGYYRKWECGYEVTDDAGNKSLFTFTMVQYDTTAPVITGVPPDLEVVCNGVVSPPDPGVRAEDNCSFGTEVAVRESLLFDPLDSTRQAIVRTWSAMDNCGNRAESSQTISVCGFDAIQASSGLGNTVWQDDNGNGLQDPDEPGLNEISVNLYWVNPNRVEEKVKIDSALTSSMAGRSGQFLFHHLMAGKYQIEFVAPENMHFTTYKSGDDDAIDSDVEETTSMTQIIEVGVEEMLTDFDAGLVFSEVPAYQLIGFAGTSQECTNTLWWSTVFENTVDHFEVHRIATDGNLHVLESVDPKGEPGAPAAYEVEDSEPLFEGIYRLAIYLTDGSVEFSEDFAIALECEDEVGQELQTYPNPVRDKVTIGFLIDRETPITLKLVDNLGRVIREEQKTLRKGRYLDQVDLSDQPDGVYWINMIFHKEVKTRMIVKSR